MKVKENEIRSIIISDDTGAKSIFTRVDGIDLYSVEYRYNDDPEYNFCKYCGELYDKNLLSCPFCEETTKYLGTEVVIDQVYSLLNDGCVVSIELKNGQTKSFKL